MEHEDEEVYPVNTTDVIRPLYGTSCALQLHSILDMVGVMTFIGNIAPLCILVVARIKSKVKTERRILVSIIFRPNSESKYASCYPSDVFLLADLSFVFRD